MKPREGEAVHAGQPDEPGVWRTLATLPGPVKTLLIGVAVNRMGSFVPIFLVLYLTRIGFQPAQAGLALTSYGVGSVIGVFAGGFVTDRFGAKRTIVASMAAAGLVIGMLPLAHSLAYLFPLSATAGLLAQLYRPASAVMLAALTPPHRLVMTSAAYRLGLNIGATVGPLLGGILAAHSFVLVFMADAVTSLLFAVIALTQLSPSPAGPNRNPVARGKQRAVLSDASYLRVVLAMFLIALVEVQYMAALPLEIKDRGLSTGIYVTIVSLNALLVITMELPLTRYLRRWRIRTAITLGVALIGLGITLFGVRGGVVLLLVAAVTWTLGEIVSAPSAAAYPVLVAPESHRGRYIGAFTGSQAAGYAVGPAIGTFLFQHTQGGVWLLCALAGAAATAAMWSGVQEPVTHPQTKSVTGSSQLSGVS